MRLPPQHPAPCRDTARARCAYLEALAVGLRGVCLSPAARAVATSRSRGRHGVALQWHLGLAAHDPSPLPDWEDRIEVKLLTIWRRADGALACDKLKICEANADPRSKLGNVLWVLADHATRVVVGHVYTTLAGPLREHLAASWYEDPHFGVPVAYVESRDSVRGSNPAYYLTPAFVMQHVLAQAGAVYGVFEHGSVLTAQGVSRWSQQTGGGSRARDVGAGAVVARETPVLLVDCSTRSRNEQIRCPCCASPLELSVEAVSRHGLLDVPHAGSAACQYALVRVMDESCLISASLCSRDEQRELVEDRLPIDAAWRVSDRVLEPADHLHE